MSSTSASAGAVINSMISKGESTILHSSIDFGATRNCRDWFHSSETKIRTTPFTAVNKAGQQKGKLAARPLPFLNISIPCAAFRCFLSGASKSLSARQHHALAQTPYFGRLQQQERLSKPEPDQQSAWHRRHQLAMENQPGAVECCGLMHAADQQTKRPRTTKIERQI
jgi:hypothetical protein